MFNMFSQTSDIIGAAVSKCPSWFLSHDPLGKVKCLPEKLGNLTWPCLEISGMKARLPSMRNWGTCGCQSENSVSPNPIFSKKGNHLGLGYLWNLWNDLRTSTFARFLTSNAAVQLAGRLQKKTRVCNGKSQWMSVHRFLSIHTVVA